MTHHKLLLLTLLFTAGLAWSPQAADANRLLKRASRDAGQTKQVVKRPTDATTRRNRRAPRKNVGQRGRDLLRRAGLLRGGIPTDISVRKFGKTRTLVKRLLRDVKVKGVDANDPANGWGIPADPEWKNYIGFVQEAEAKFQVASGADAAIEAAMTRSDLAGLFGSRVGDELAGVGVSIVKQADKAGATRYSDIYLDVADGTPLATEAGISIRHRQIGDQIGTEAGMFEVKLYTDEGDNGPVQDRLEIRKRTNDDYRKSDLIARKPELRQQNPLTYLGKAIGRRGDLRRLKDAEFTPFITISQNRVEYNLRDQEGRSLYLVTLDRVTGSYAGDRPRTARDGRTVRKGDSASHAELEVEQMFNSADPAFHAVLSRLSGKRVTEGNADAVSKAVLTKMTTAMETAVDGLSRSGRNKPGIVAQRLGLID